MKHFTKYLSGLLIVTMLLLSSSITSFAQDNSPTPKIDTRSDIQIVNDCLKEKGCKEIKDSDIKFLEKDGQWNKIVKYFKNGDKRANSLDYKVITFNDGSLAVVPKGCNVTVSKSDSTNDIILNDDQLTSNTNAGNPTNSSIASLLNDSSTVIATSDTYYGRGRFDGYMYSDFTITDRSITTTGMKIWYHYKSDTAHSISPYCSGNNYYYYCSSSSASSYTYNVVQFTGMVNGTYNINYAKDATGIQANCYGEIGDGPV